MPLHRLFRSLAVVYAGLLLAAPAFGGGTAPKRPVVVELYTSQGCDSCPPADAVLSQLADRKDVIALTLPVTYWDMLGWKDTLASDANTRRQKAYADAMGHGGVYTPQMIIDGVSDVVGSRAQAVDAAIAARAADMSAVPVLLSATKSEVHVFVGASPAQGGATIWLFRVLSKARVKVTGGENSGRTLSYRNVVRDVKSIGLWKGQPVSLDLPRDAGTVPHDAIAVVVQQGGGYGRIVGAAMIGVPDIH
jgi:hypothetical protein